MIDAHCHLQDDRFGDKLPAIIEAAQGRGVETFVVNGTFEKDWEQVAELARTYPCIVPCFGLHPWYVAERSHHWLETLRTYLEDFPDSGVGEIGLDRWIRGYDIEDQLPVFEAQWALGVELDRPISVHCLKAWGHLEASLKGLPEHRFLLHSYSGPVEMVPTFANQNAYFSISGYFLKPEKSAKLEVFNQVPDDRLLLETDAPAMELPEDLDLYEGETFNHPANLAVVYEQVAERKAIPKDELKRRIAENVNEWLKGSPR